MAYFLGGTIPFPAGTAVMFVPLYTTYGEQTILSSTCDGTGRFADISTVPPSPIIVLGYYGMLLNFTVKQSAFAPYLYFVHYYPGSPYPACLQLPFTNFYAPANTTLYIFFAFSFGT